MSFPPAILVPAVVSRLRSALPALRREFPLKKLGVFGSTARGDAGPESDIDILVEVDPSIGLRFVTLAERLEAELGRKVDLVSRRGLKPAMWASIEQDLIDVEAGGQSAPARHAGGHAKNSQLHGGHGL